RARSRRWIAASRGAGGTRHGDRTLPRLARAPVARRRADDSRRDVAGGRRDRGGAGCRRGRDAAARGPRTEPRVVRRRFGRRTFGGMAAVKASFARALLRLFAVQGSYNYERMLGVGVGVAEEP